MGRGEFGEAVAHFVERSNAVALKRRLVARGETVRVERSLVHGLSEEEGEAVRRLLSGARVRTSAGSAGCSGIFRGSPRRCGERDKRLAPGCGYDGGSERL